MTTIAYHHKDKRIAVDSRSTRGREITTDSSCKTITNELGMWVLCGSPSDYKDFVSLVRNDIFNKDVELDVSGLLVRDGCVYSVFMDDGIFNEEPLSSNYSCGSGRDFSTAAMDFGKSAEDAIKYAMTRDVYTGGKIQVIDVETGNVI